jgi:ABC-type dipeptide/oligopeptide/nickel transport system permease subunit
VLILVLTVFGWMFSARVVWSLTASLREREYVQAARYMGVGPIRIVVRHLIPNLGSLLIVSFTLGVVLLPVRGRAGGRGPRRRLRPAPWPDAGHRR